MSDPSNHVESKTVPETASDVTEPKLDESSNRTWKNVEIINSFGDKYNQQCHYLLRKTATTVTSTLGDISINFQVVKFTLDRTILISRSNFLFEYLIQHDEKDIVRKINEIMNNDDERFSNIVDIIYGKDLKLVLSESNFSQLFADMNKMAMEIDLKIFKDFIGDNIKPKSELNHLMFDLYDILSNSDRKFDCLLPLVSSYFSDRLLLINRKEEFLSMSAKGFVTLLMNKSDNSLEKRFIGRICASWICREYQIRIRHMINLVNVARYRYEVVPRYYNGNWNSSLIKSCQVEEVEKYFNKLYVEINFDSPLILKNELGCAEPGVVYSIDQVTRWMEILEKSLFYDVAINAQGTIFKLHRVKLYLASEYFRNLFTNHDELSNLPTEDESFSVISIPKEYSIAQIDPVTFQSVIHYIYTQEIEVTSETHLINLIKCSKFLEMDDLFANCSSIMLEIAKNDRVYDIFEVFQCAYETARYSKLYDVLVEKIRTAWTTLDENRYLKTISLDILKEILAIPLNPYKIVAFCSKWIFHDIENRYHHTTEIARAINRIYTLDRNQSKLKVPVDSTEYTLQFVKEQLDSILSSTALVSINKGYFENESETPRFRLLNEDGLFSGDYDRVDGNFDGNSDGNSDKFPIPIDSGMHDLKYPNDGIQGLAILLLNDFKITNEDGTTTSTAFSIDTDELNLIELLESMGFVVEPHRNCTKEELVSVIEKVRTKIDLGKYNCLMIVLITLGKTSNCAQAHDLKSFDVEKVIIRPFSSTQCPELIGKPKIFLLEFCRGEMQDAGFPVIFRTPNAAGVDQVDGDTKTDEPESSKKTRTTTDQPAISDSSDSSDSSDYSDSSESNCDSRILSLPGGTDILIVESSQPNFLSWSHNTKGSFFINAFCSVMKSSWQNDDFLSILTRVNRVLALNYPETTDSNSKKQISTVHHTLLRDIRFRQIDPNDNFSEWMNRIFVENDGN